KDGYEDYLFNIEWEPEGKTEYSVNLKEKLEDDIFVPILTTVVTNGRVEKKWKIRKERALKETIERSPNVKSVTRITNYNDKTLWVSNPVVSRDGESLIYVLTVLEQTKNKGEVKAYSNIWAQKIGSPLKTRITFGRYSDQAPCFVEDGARIIFSSDRNSVNHCLWSVGANGGGGLTKLTGNQSDDMSPSSGGDYIAFESEIPGADAPQIWSVRLDGSFLTQLREGESPSMRRDGKKILFIRKDERTEKEQIWVMDVDGGHETLLSNDPEVSDIDPQYSPDGQYIIFASDAGVDQSGIHNYDIWIMNSDGSNRTQLTTNGSRDTEPCWSPDGKYVYFRSNRGLSPNIWRFELTSGLVKKKGSSEPPSSLSKDTPSLNTLDKKIYQRLGLDAPGVDVENGNQIGVNPN
ncbi:MAG: hypothetical protein D6732_08275, partial [Methanobacteriota archaeon]